MQRPDLFFPDLLMMIETMRDTPDDCSVIIVETRTGYMRRLIHILAEQYKLNHTSCRFKPFENNYLFFCKECKRSWYFDELICTSAERDPVFWCPEEGCDSGFCHDDMWDSDTRLEFKIRKTFNSVLISKAELPKKHGKYIAGHISRTTLTKREVENDMPLGDLMEAINKKFPDSTHLRQVNSFAQISDQVQGIRTPKIKTG